MTFRLLVDAPFPEDGTSVYRGWGPLTALRREADVELVSIHNLSTNASGTRLAWPEIRNVDAVFLQRPFSPDRVMIATLAATYKKPIWVDYDDDLLGVPRDNPTHHNYARPDVRHNISEICRMADIVTTSTKFLGKKISQFNPKVMVVPNALDMKLLHRLDDSLPRNKTVVWRGSHCHFSDVHKNTQSILEAYHKFKDWNWMFVGWDPTFITDQMDLKTRARTVPFSDDYPNYMGNLQKIRGAIHIVPLVSHDFNLSKSRIAHLESSLAGSACLAPAWEEWEGGQLYRYGTASEFREKLFQMMSTPLPELQATNNKDWEWVARERSLDSVNQLRIGILESFKKRSR